MLPLVRIEPGIYDFKSDSVFSQLTRHFFISLRLLRSLYNHAVLILGESSKAKKWSGAWTEGSLKIP